MSEKEKKEKSKSFILRVDSETMNAIEAWAADEFRSTNGQIQWILNEALKKSGRLKKKKTANVDDADSLLPIKDIISLSYIHFFLS